MSVTMLLRVSVAVLLFAFGPAGEKGWAAPKTKPNLAGKLTPERLRCENAGNPLGVDTLTPRLSWGLRALDPAARGLRQSAYRVLVGSSVARLAQGRADLWDSGRMQSSQTDPILYSGRPLQAAATVFWKVQVWDQAGRPSSWSPTAQWTMGLLQPHDWHSASWIGAQTDVGTGADLIGYHAAETTDPDNVKWVQVDLGAALPISAVRLQPMQHAGKDGFGFPVRFRVEAASEPTFAAPISLANQTAADFPNPGVTPVSFPVPGLTARYVRVTATKLWKRDASVYAFALHRLEVISSGRNAAAGVAVTAKDSAEFSGWGKVGLTFSAAPRANAARTDSVLLRRRFTVHPHLTRALAFVCGLGQYELTVNGHKAGRDVLAPGWSKYDKTCLYDTRDITALLQAGPNAAGLLLGNGMYNVHSGRYTKFTGSFGPQKAIALIRLEYADGHVETVRTDDRWRMAAGPLTFSSVYGGEDYDARLLAADWDHPQFDDGGWETALVVPGPGGVLRGLGSAAPSIEMFETFPPVAVRPLRPGVTVYDLGQNAAVLPRLTVTGPAGATVQITPAELVHADGSVDRASVGDSPAYWKYTLAGHGTETYVSKFFYHGCRYLQVELTPAADGTWPTVHTLAGVVVGSASAPAGRFTCSNTLFNRISTLTRWAQRSNMVSILTDCPHRERLGWLEEAHLNGPSLRFNFDLDRLFSKIENDMADSQTGGGLIPSIAPEYVRFGGDSPDTRNDFGDSPEWGSAFLLVPWQQYQFTGDTFLLTRHYDAMKRYVAHLTSRSQDGIVRYGLGDWYDIGPKEPGYSQLTPSGLTATAFYYQDAVILAHTAALLGRSEEEKEYQALADRIQAAFHRTFWNADTHQYGTGSQCANALPLVLGLVPRNEQPAVLAAIIADIRQRGNAFTAGDIGYRYLLQALAEGGRSDVIFDMNNQSDKPGYGYQLKQGATSLTEAWDARRSSSQNHFMLGQINEWFYGSLAGIQPDPSGPGFQKFFLRPVPVGDVRSVEASYVSRRGTIHSHWTRSDHTFTLEVTIPPNTTATISIPTSAPAGVLEGGRAAAGSPGVTLRQAETSSAVYVIGSGTYHFQAAAP